MKKLFKFKMRLSALVLTVGLTGATSTAQAGCTPCGFVAAYIEVNAAAIASSILDTANTMAEQFSQTVAVMGEKFLQAKLAAVAMEGSTSSVVAAEDKLIHALGQLTQAGINYKTEQYMLATSARAQEMYTTPQADSFQTCAYEDRSKQASAAAADAGNDAKYNSAMHTRRNMGTVNANDEAKSVQSNYAKSYCSDGDQKAGVKDPETGKVCTPVAVELQNAGIRADVFLSPVANMTYSAQEAKAAEDFIVMVTNPIPVELLPESQEKSLSGDKFQLAMMSVNARLSAAQYVMEQSRASKVALDLENPGASGYTGALSVIGNMQRFVQERFGNEKYTDKLDASTNGYGLYKELSLQMAFNNWMDFHGYLQNERIEGMLAVELAAAATKRADRQMSLAKSMVKGR